MMQIDNDVYDRLVDLHLMPNNLNIDNVYDYFYRTFGADVSGLLLGLHGYGPGLGIDLDFHGLGCPIYIDNPTSNIIQLGIQLTNFSFSESVVPLCNWGDPVTLTTTKDSLLSDDFQRLQSDSYFVQIGATGVDGLGFIASPDDIGDFSKAGEFFWTVSFEDTMFYYLQGTADFVKQHMQQTVVFGATPESSLQFVIIPDDFESNHAGAVETFKFVAVNDSPFPSPVGFENGNGSLGA